MTRSGLLGWVAVACLAMSCALTGGVLLHRGPGFATLPIFVPASLAHEKAMRAEHGQPAGKGGVEAVELAESLLRDDSVANDPALAIEVAALGDTRAKLLDARNRRHALNIRLMDVGVAVAHELTPAQWDAIHMRRDEIRGKAEKDLFARLLAKLGGAGAGSQGGPHTEAQGRSEGAGAGATRVEGGDPASGGALRGTPPR